MFSLQMEEDPFNPDYVEVDRVLEVSYCEDKDTGEVMCFLFFWAKTKQKVTIKVINHWCMDGPLYTVSSTLNSALMVFYVKSSDAQLWSLFLCLSISLNVIKLHWFYIQAG